ncbi:hypothetical protein [Pseudomonas sp. SCPG-7]|uniref:hypothetical protein n=1 Tax=Pseudomonas sp. SCPG-7 TaxID=1961714 RepID=UPI000A39BF49|nr:hypothetical protein [Pseudomonas sp. SCPG-7]
MKILVALVTENDFLRKEFVKLRSTIRLPANLSRLPMTLELDAPDLSRSPTLEPYFHTKATSCGAMVVLADRRCERRLNFTETALFIHWLDVPRRVELPSRFLNHHSSRLLTSFATFRQEVMRGENLTMCILPAKNFDADEWRQLITMVLTQAQEDLFAVDATALLVLMRRNRRKQRRKDPTGRYFYIDDDDKHFIYGPEHHSKFATGEPHTKTCELNGTFRFGAKVEDIHRHFNVNRGPGKNPSVKGSFYDCHCAPRVVIKTSHLNMFMNDYF